MRYKLPWVRMDIINSYRPENTRKVINLTCVTFNTPVPPTLNKIIRKLLFHKNFPLLPESSIVWESLSEVEWIKAEGTHGFGEEVKSHHLTFMKGPHWAASVKAKTLFECLLVSENRQCCWSSRESEMS